jgi:hypothetical protein
MKIDECLYCNVCPSIILPVLFCFIEFTCYIHSYKSHKFHSYIHFMSIFMYINIHAHITCIQTSFIHVCITTLCLISFVPKKKVSSLGVSGSNVSPTFSISNGMFSIEQFESTFLPCFIGISNGMFSIGQFENTFYLVSSVFQTACSPSNSLKVRFYLISPVFQMACSPSNSLKVRFYLFPPSISNGMFSIEQFENTFNLVSSVFQMACSSLNSLKIRFYLISPSISNGMFSIEQFENTYLPCFPVLQATCSPSDGL